MSFLDIFKPKAAELVCPRCEKPLSEHDEAACTRRMSRRFFFQAVGGAAVAAVVAPVFQMPTYAPATMGMDLAPIADHASVTVIEEWSKVNGIVTRRILSESRILLDEAIWPGKDIPVVIIREAGIPFPELAWSSRELLM